MVYSFKSPSTHKLLTPQSWCTILNTHTAHVRPPNPSLHTHPVWFTVLSTHPAHVGSNSRFRCQSLNHSVQQRTEKVFVDDGLWQDFTDTTDSCCQRVLGECLEL